MINTPPGLEFPAERNGDTLQRYASFDSASNAGVGIALEHDAIFDAALGIESDRLHEECGVLALTVHGMDVARMLRKALPCLQHRGQAAAGMGIRTADGGVYIQKAAGLIVDVFPDETMADAPEGSMGVAHVRYSTIEAPDPDLAAHPYQKQTSQGEITVAANANLTNVAALRAGKRYHSLALHTAQTDIEMMTWMIAAEIDKAGDFHDGLRAALRECEGAYTAVVMTEKIHAIRDPQGIRPLVIGRLPGGHHVVASESVALDEIGAELIRDAEPGELIEIDADGGLTSIKEFLPLQQERKCAFEKVYFAQSGSRLGGPKGRLVGDYRYEMGVGLYEDLVAAGDDFTDELDIIVPVLNSGLEAARGFADASGVPLVHALERNPYAGRTFIEPGNHAAKVKAKFTPKPGLLAGMRVGLVDDSIVRGNTSGPLVAMLRKAGALEISMLSGSPMIKDGCNLGVDMSTRSELIAARHEGDLDSMAAEIGAERVRYLSYTRLTSIIGDSACYACMGGEHPNAVPRLLREAAVSLRRVPVLSRAS